ncbi:PREDICTED: uncharacterized protein LOC105458382 [Wasmannia auropunctata]|uniref:uncharacterized protein LOC105458382 n=1 Tax=Wasmannia auropunctata TaxID=64793 RepID=UPI0005F04495|nr:PREDICTED: uncharacterized protein LOC105458382 [Wasmannia auropunctata]
METLESSRVCRLCGQQSGISINIFDESENHVRKINAVLPIMVHEMDLLPKQMCHRCSYKLEEFHKFYVDCLKTDAALKSQLSWMRKGGGREKVGVPMVHIENMKIKAEPLDYDVYELEPLVENIDYINSMNSVAFRAGGIHDGLTYAAFSRYRCCCDKKDQSRPRRTTAGLCQNYEGQTPRSGRVADVSRKRTLEDTAAARLELFKRSPFTQSVFPDCPQNRLPRVENAVENARDRPLATDTSTKDNVASSPETRNHSHGRLEASPKSQTIARSTIVRNLRPRKNLVNYTSNKKRISSVNPGPSALTKSNVSETTPAADFELVRQIKVEQTDESEGRNLRPRKNVVDYQEPKMRKIAEHRAKRRKNEQDEQGSRLHSKDGSASNALNFEIKQETVDNLEVTVLVSETTTDSAPQLSSGFAALPAKIEAMTSDNDVTLRDDYFRSQFQDQFQLAERRSLSHVMKNNRLKTKKYRFSSANCSPKYLRSQDAYLRNGKTRKSDYMEWSMKRLQTRKLMVNKSAKKSPMLKVSENIKHYCESCNVSFMNKELFRLHACYYD